MDKLRTDKQGGYPAVIELFKFLQDSNINALSHLSQMLGTDTYVLWGCNYTEDSSKYNISAGAWVWNGEIIQVDSHVCNKESDPLIEYAWKLEETDDPDGQMQFYDGTSKNVFAKRRLKVVSGAFSQNAEFMGSETRVSDLIDSLIGSNYMSASLSWLEPSYQNGWGGYSSGDMQPLKYAKQDNGIVFLEGYIDPSSQTGEIVFTLPPNYRPSNLAKIQTPEYMKSVQIFPNGEVKVLQPVSTDTRYYINISFSIV